MGSGRVAQVSEIIREHRRAQTIPPKQKKLGWGIGRTRRVPVTLATVSQCAVMADTKGAVSVAAYCGLQSSRLLRFHAIPRGIPELIPAAYLLQQRRHQCPANVRLSSSPSQRSYS